MLLYIVLMQIFDVSINLEKLVACWNKVY